MSTGVVVCSHQTVLAGVCQMCGKRVAPPLALGVLAAFEGTCVELRCNPHNVTELTVVIVQHHPRDEDDIEHHHHNRAASGVDVAIDAEQMSHFVPGKKYRVTITAMLPILE